MISYLSVNVSYLVGKRVFVSKIYGAIALERTVKKFYDKLSRFDGRTDIRTCGQTHRSTIAHIVSAMRRAVKSNTNP